MNKIKAYIFDLDGVIADTAMLHYQAWKTIATELGIDIDLQFNEGLKGVDRQHSLEKILDYGQLHLSEDKIKYWMNRKNDMYVESLTSLSTNDILPGIPELITMIKADGCKVGIASGSKNAPFILKKLQLMNQVDYIANPDLVTAPKPAPDIFQDVATYFNLNGWECVGIEDAQVGIEAINQAQMFSVGIGSRLVEADLTFASTEQLDYSSLKKIVNTLKKGENNE